MQLKYVSSQIKSVHEFQYYTTNIALEHQANLK